MICYYGQRLNKLLMKKHLLLHDYLLKQLCTLNREQRSGKTSIFPEQGRLGALYAILQG